MRFMGIFGMLAILAIGYLLSNNKKRIKPRVMANRKRIDFIVVVQS